MKIFISRHIVAAAVAILALGTATVAHAGTCSNASLKGQYGQNISGEILPAPGSCCLKTGSL